ncbi:cytochrome p450 [Holotrichia oblita]|uniref:Cytochrome p450 n=1 Tax=Holotrichia oblita TaxID=644536 RepID=A0ACB9SNB8_HOLOL|nr:cytochrome p450 [Holotrichia oblita]
MKAQKHDFCGIYVFTQPSYMPINPEYVKDIMLKDFSNFVDRGMYYNEKTDPLSVHLLSLGGQRWKNLRAKLTPTFTSGKMKTMFGTLINCGNQMVESMRKLSEKPLDIKDVCACYTTDVIGSCAFGLDCNSFAESESEFRKFGKKAFAISAQNIARIVFCSSFGNLAKKLGVRLIDPDVSDFFINIVNATLKYRQENKIERNDFLQLLIGLKENNELTTEEVAAQAFIFFLAGFETSSTTMSSCLLELAQNQDIQDKVREEVVQIFSKNDGKLMYDSLMDMKYLGHTIAETLRLYPTIPLIQRQCTTDYAIRNTDIRLEKGTRVLLPTYALHRDPEYYPDPNKFDPDRFNDEAKSKRHPFVYLPFGEGPRVCIGERFGLMQVKIGLAMLLKDYKFVINPKTKLPVEFDKNGFLLSVKGSIWLNAIKL